MNGKNEFFQIPQDKNTPQAPINERTLGVEYKKEFTSYFSNLMKKAGLTGDETTLRFLEKGDTDRNLSAYTEMSEKFKKYINTPIPAIRLNLLSDQEINMGKTMLTHHEVTEIIHSKADVPLIMNELASNKLDEPRKNILQLIASILDPEKIKLTGKEISLPLGEFRTQAGYCRDAERHFLDFISGTHESQKKNMGGQMIVVLDADGGPLFLYDTGYLGNQYSCLSLQPTLLNGYTLPAGSLFEGDENGLYNQAERLKLNQIFKKTKSINGVMDLSDFRGLKYFRLGPLSIDPNLRDEVCPGFYSHFKNKNINYPLATPLNITEFINLQIKK